MSDIYIRLPQLLDADAAVALLCNDIPTCTGDFNPMDAYRA